MISSPRRYCLDGEERRVLIGLTLQETLRFEALEELLAHGACGEMPAWGQHEQTKAGNEQRWSELYARHETAWRRWMADKDGH